MARRTAAWKKNGRGTSEGSSFDLAVLSGLFAACVLLGPASCSWQVGSTRHYVGPTLFRSTSPPERAADVAQTRNLPWLFEFGETTSGSVGFVDRVAALPLPLPGSNAPPPSAPAADWSALLGIPLGANSDSWVLSLFHLKATNLRRPQFVMRRMIGMQLIGGIEGRGVSLGYHRSTLVRPDDDRLYAFRFDSSRPMEMLFHEWKWQPDEAPPTSIILKEFGE